MSIDEKAYHLAIQPTNFAGGIKQPGGQTWLRQFLEHYEAAKAAEQPVDKPIVTGCGDYICEVCNKRAWFAAPHDCQTPKDNEKPDSIIKKDMLELLSDLGAAIDNGMSNKGLDTYMINAIIKARGIIVGLSGQPDRLTFVKSEDIRPYPRNELINATIKAMVENNYISDYEAPDMESALRKYLPYSPDIISNENFSPAIKEAIQSLENAHSWLCYNDMGREFGAAWEKYGYLIKSALKRVTIALDGCVYLC